jgi:hypothetical protein
MVVFYSPPPKPVDSDVVYEHRISGVDGLAKLQGVVNVSAGSLSYTVQVAPAGTRAITLRLSAGNVIPMRASDPSLRKKSRTERMGRLEREYHW